MFRYQSVGCKTKNRVTVTAIFILQIIQFIHDHISGSNGASVGASHCLILLGFQARLEPSIIFSLSLGEDITSSLEVVKSRLNKDH